MRILGLLGLCLIFFLPGAAHADATAKQEDTCHPVASIYEQNVCAAALEISPKLENNLRAYAKQSGKSADKEIRDFKLSTLFGLLWQKALIHKFGEDALSASNREIKSYLKAFHKTLKSQNKANKNVAALIAELMEKNEYAPQDYDRLNKMSIQTQRSIMMFDMRSAAPSEMKKRMDKNERNMAENMVSSWKAKKLLYEEYGGAIIFQQLGLEPLDGFKALLEEIEENGDLIIHDKEYKQVFKTMEKYVKADHNVVPEGSPEIAAYFSSPNWVYDADNVDESFEDQKAVLMAIKPIEPEPEPEQPEEEEENEE